MSDNYQSGKSSTGIVQEVAVKYDVNEENAFTMVNRAHGGLSVSAFYDLIKISGLSNEELAGLLDLSYKSIQRYKKEGKKLNAQNSEQLLKMIALYQKAEEVFGDLESFNRWLRKPAAGLGNRVPMQFLQTSGGIDLIREELLRIEYGALA